MNAVILNSGLGNRMGEFTRTHHKCMAVLGNGETIFERQLRVLRACGIRNFVVTVGPFAEQLREKAAQPRFADCRFTWVPNPVYDRTNYIYSLYLAREHLHGDFLLLHGDLVFSRATVERLLEDGRANLGTVQPDLPLPEKDFKAQLSDGKIRRISVKIFGDDCAAFQPLYKLSRTLLDRWLERMGVLIERGDTGVYAEEALNELLAESDDCVLEPFDSGSEFVGEVDTQEDLKAASAAIRLCDFRQQKIVDRPDAITALGAFAEDCGLRKVLLVAGGSVDRQPFAPLLQKLSAETVRFSDFTANPTDEEVLRATGLFRAEDCDGIVAIGGGSAIDIGKCVKLFAAQPTDADPFSGEYACSHIPMLAVPTTAGTGSESTAFSAVYVRGVKRSVQHDSMLPDEVILDAGALATLPRRQRCAALFDAVCQCVESVWSLRATEESRQYALDGLQLLLEHAGAYLAGEAKSAPAVLRGANLGGRAINLSQTTAVHAMSYELTQRLGLPHGYAVALCMSALLPLMLEKRAQAAAGFEQSLRLLGMAFGADTPEETAKRLSALLQIPNEDLPERADCPAAELAGCVNAQRLANNPVQLTTAELTNLYETILHKINGKG